MMDFLAENYVWFFVIAVVLLFALIGFIVGSKRKKKKNEFKGESVDTATDNNVNNDMVVNDIPVAPSEITPATNSEELKTEVVGNMGTVNETQNNDLGSVPMHDFNPSTVSEAPASSTSDNTSNVEAVNNRIESTPSQTENVVPTAPESFYDEPLMSEPTTQEPMSFEVQSEQNNVQNNNQN